jgi:hypothetical protein
MQPDPQPDPPQLINHTVTAVELAASPELQAAGIEAGDLIGYSEADLVEAVPAGE